MSDNELECRDDVEFDVETETWDDWVDDGSDTVFRCLFCDAKFPAEDPLHGHLQSAHSFSLKSSIAKLRVDTYGTIQLVNFLRRMHINGMAVDAIAAKLESEGAAAFQHDDFLQPVVQDDPLLYCLECADSDSDDEDDEAQEQKHSEPPSRSGEKATSEASDTLVEQLQKENEELKQQLLKYTRLVRDFVVEDDGESSNAVVDKADNDTYYFDSYSHVGIHREMITDQVRTDGYRNAILNNPELFKGKVVLDVGCGTGILSMFAAQAGAARVIGIDQSEMGVVAQQIVKDNGLQDVVTIIKGKVEQLELPAGVDKVDVIISEWMGYCLLYESMLDTVLFARDKWLAPGGHLFPDKSSMYIQGMYDSQERVRFWDNVYGFNMQAVKAKISIRDAFVENVDPKDILTDRALLKDIDIDHVTYEQLDYRSEFVLRVAKSGTMHGFVSSFDIGFERGCGKPEYFTTGAEGTPTHWHQVFFHVESPFQVTEGQTIEGKWWVRRNGQNPRYLDVELEWKVPGSTAFTHQSFRLHD